MVSYVLDVDKAGDLKFGSKKCRLHKKGEVVKVAKDYGIPSASKKTVKELCGALKTKIMKAERVSNQIKKNLKQELEKEMAARKVAAKKQIKNNLNNVPLAKLYPEAAKKQVAAKKRAEKKVFDRKVATNFLKTMVTERVVTPTRKVVVAVMPMPKPSKKAMPLTKEEANKRIGAMKGLSYENRNKLQRMVLNQHSPRRVVRVARELARLR